MKPLKDLFKDFFTPGHSPTLNEHSSLLEIAVLYPKATDFIERKYGIKIDANDKTLSLKEFVEKLRLPPAPVVFMEIQLDAREVKIDEVSPKNLKSEMLLENSVQLLDVREDWELKICKLKNSVPLTASLLDEILHKWDKGTRIVLYCHHGVRSSDAAVFLVDRGFSNVSILKGGIDAWSTEVDPKIARYHGAYC